MNELTNDEADWCCTSTASEREGSSERASKQTNKRASKRVWVGKKSSREKSLDVPFRPENSTSSELLGRNVGWCCAVVFLSILSTTQYFIAVPPSIVG